VSQPCVRREVDFANAVPREHVERLTRDPQIQMLRGRETQRIGVILNLQHLPFKDVRVRHALLGYGIDRQAIVKTALLGQAQPLWSFVPPGSRGHIDFGEQFPYDPEKAEALLKAAGFDQKNPLRYAIMTHGAEAALPSIATIIKSQYAKFGVEVTVDVIDRPIFLRWLTRDRDWEQTVNGTGAALDPHTIDRAIDTRAGNNTINHVDTQLDVLIDRMKEAGTDEAFFQAGYDFQGSITENMMTTSVASLPFLQAARASVKGYEHLHGFKIRFENTWLDKP
jgi:peptide/nickel transport system substrate-binding protein